VQDEDNEDVNNELNAFANHAYDGFFNTEVRRLNRFASLVEANKNHYFVHHSADPAIEYRY
jgi:hypothetical protein